MTRDRAQSEVTGAILLTAVVVLSVSAIGYTAVQRGTDAPEAPSANIAVEVTNQSVAFVHNGGDAVPTADLRVVVRENGTDRGVTWAGGTLDGDGDDRFEPGEEWETNVDLDPRAVVRVLLVETETSSVLAEATVNPEPVRGAEDVNAPPRASFTYSPTNPAAGETVTFTSTSSDSDGTITSRRWAVDGTTVATGERFTRRFDASGRYDVTLTVTDNGSAKDSVTRTVSVGESTQKPVASFTASPNPANVSETVAFDAGGSSDPDGGALDYAWRFGDGDTATGRTATHAYGSTGEYTVTLTVTDDEGRTASDTETVQIREKPVTDPGFAFRDINRDGLYTDGVDEPVPRSKLADGTYDAGGERLVVPESVGTIDAGGSKVAIAGEGLIIRVSLQSDKDVTLDGKSRSVRVTDVSLNNYQNSNGDGEITITAEDSIDFSESSAASAKRIRFSSDELIVTEATLNNYQNSNGDGTVELVGTNGVDARQASVQSGSAIRMQAINGPVALQDASVNNYQNSNGDGEVTVTAGRSLNLRDGTVDSAKDISLSGRDVAVTGARLNNYQNSNGDGELSIDATGTIEAGGTTFNSSKKVALTGKSMRLVGATLNNYQSSNGDGEITLDANESIDATAVTLRSAKRVRVTAGSLDIDDGIINNYQDSNGDGQIALDVGGAVYANRTGLESAKDIRVTTEGELNLNDATLNNYQDSNGDGQINIDANGAVLAARTDVESAKDVTMSGMSVNLTEGLVNNYQDSNGDGTITIRTDGGNAYLNRTRFDSKKQIVGDIDGSRTLFVEGAEILNKGEAPGSDNPGQGNGGKPTMCNENGATVVGDPDRGRVDSC